MRPGTVSAAPRPFLALAPFAFVPFALTFFALALSAISPAEAESRAAAGRSTAPREGAPLNLSDLSELWGHGVEAAIESAYRDCFRTFVVDDRIVTIRIPFGENTDRSELAGTELAVKGGGKADPAELWKGIATLLESEDFHNYEKALDDGNEKVIVFDLVKRSWEVSHDIYLVARARSGLYPGLPHRPVVLSTGQGTDTGAIYDYLFAVGGLGMDCSGFVWHALSTVARAGGVDLAKALGRYTGAPTRASTSLYIGTWFFTPNNKAFELVDDRISKLRPADIIVFRDQNGKPVHSAIIQSIDRKNGIIRYLQSTDEAPRDVRGVHESFIGFDPAHPEVRLSDLSLVWSQRREAAFDGEPASAFPDDGSRFRAWMNEGIFAGTGLGGGFVVRVKALAPAIKKLSAKATKR